MDITVSTKKEHTCNAMTMIGCTHRFERITRCKLTIISESAICKKFLGQIWSYAASL
jgi:hypothetical protein